MPTKKVRRIKSKGPTLPLIDARRLAEALGAEHITDPKEIAKFKKKYRIRRP